MQYLAEFRRFFPGEFRHALYPTRDRVIPFRAFWTLYECIPGLEARDRINQTRATITALGCAFAEKGAPMLSSLRDDLAAAYFAPKE